MASTLMTLLACAGSQLMFAIGSGSAVFVEASTSPGSGVEINYMTLLGMSVGTILRFGLFSYR